MIEPDKRRGFRWLFYRYQKHHLIPRYFETVGVSGEIDDHLDVPTLYIANHSSWWDGLLIFQMTQRFSNDDHYIMMNESGLKEYPFFRKLGAYSVNRHRPRDVIKALSYTQELMLAGKKVWLFPQGGIQHPERYIYFQRGLGHILKQFDQVAVKPFTFHYYTYDYPKMMAAVDIGEATMIGPTMGQDEMTMHFEQLLNEQRESQVQRLIENPDAPFHLPYQPLIGRRKR
ncbi:lysophospholipid acyltransferase family protein [Alkalibacillus almallahensis]|uniref:lysophospholipid acyltransferase family protein n=1 Tax=Alkalibacillus almallahensis TaxID=1379154 RepID=UPI00141EEE56|nr:lysophospholipid acyltransferase family protein [Alkalibacillus almallahensis]NIK11394.1 hypothetical protein [Alkalibacillus almallahensis]